MLAVLHVVLDIAGVILLTIVGIGAIGYSLLSIGDYFTDRYFTRHPDRYKVFK